MKSDEVIKSSVENLVPIPSESEGNWYERIFKKKAKNKQSQARDGKDQVKSKPKSVKVRKSTQTKSKVNQMKKIQLKGPKLPNLKLYYKSKRQGSKLQTGQSLQRSYKK
ncbi:hypothetical protein Tco_1369260 [Tanacetum coccineum]